MDGDLARLRHLEQERCRAAQIETLSPRLAGTETGHVGSKDRCLVGVVVADEQGRCRNFVSAFARNIEADEIGHRTVELSLIAETKPANLELLAFIA